MRAWRPETREVGSGIGRSSRGCGRLPLTSFPDHISVPNTAVGERGLHIARSARARSGHGQR